MFINTTVHVPVEIVDEIICMTLQNVGPTTHSAIALTSRRYHIYANKSRFSTVCINNTLHKAASFEKRAASFVGLIRSGDSIHSLPAVCMFIRFIVLQPGDEAREVERFFRNSDLLFIFANLSRISPSVSFPGLAPTSPCISTLSLSFSTDFSHSSLSKLLKDFMQISQLNRLFLYNVHGLNEGTLFQSNVKQLATYNTTVAAESVQGSGRHFVNEGEIRPACPLESLDTDLGMTPGNYVALFHSRSSGIQHPLPGRMFPHLTTLKLRIKQTRCFAGCIAQINEMLLNTPALEDLWIHNGIPLHIAPRPQVTQFPLRYRHLSRLRSITLSTYTPFQQIALFEGLFADGPPPSLTEINIETIITWDITPGSDNIPSTAVYYVRRMQLDRLDAFLLRPSFEKVKKVVLKVETTHRRQFAYSDKRVEAIRWRDTMASALPHMLEKKGLEVEFQVDFERW